MNSAGQRGQEKGAFRIKISSRRFFRLRRSYQKSSRQIAPTIADRMHPMMLIKIVILFSRLHGACVDNRRDFTLSTTFFDVYRRCSLSVSRMWQFVKIIIVIGFRLVTTKPFHFLFFVLLEMLDPSVAFFDIISDSFSVSEESNDRVDNSDERKADRKNTKYCI